MKKPPKYKRTTPWHEPAPLTIIFRLADALAWFSGDSELAVRDGNTLKVLRGRLFKGSEKFILHLGEKELQTAQFDTWDVLKVLNEKDEVLWDTKFQEES
jgi:hypothetical protein